MIEIAPPLQLAVFLLIAALTVLEWEGGSGSPQWFLSLQKKLSTGQGILWSIGRWGFSFLVGIAYIFFVLSWGMYAVSPNSFHPEHSNPSNLYTVINGMLAAFLVLFKRYNWMMHAVDPAYTEGPISKGKVAESAKGTVMTFLIVHAFLIWGAAVAILSLACYYFESSTKFNSFFISAWVIIVVITTIGFILSVLYVVRWASPDWYRKYINASYKVEPQTSV